jgi:hypothetical protein
MSVFHIYNDHYAGRCFWSEKRGRVSGVFTYDDDYLSGSQNWNIDPSLALVSGAQAVSNGLPGAFCDASPNARSKIRSNNVVFHGAFYRKSRLTFCRFITKMISHTSIWDAFHPEPNDL